MARILRRALLIAFIVVAVAAIVVITVEVTRSLQNRPTEESAKTEESVKTEDTTPTDSKQAASGSSKVEEACEEAQLKLLKGEVTDPGERLNLKQDVNAYCKETTESP
jgi:uncharacterized protein with FMN-binding domain